MKNKLTALSVILCICIGQSYAQENFAARHNRVLSLQQRLIERLFQQYSPEQRPPADEEKRFTPVIVEVSIYVSSVQFDDNVAEVQFYLRQNWVDSRLKYEGEEFEYLRIPNDKAIWMPDTYFAGVESESDDVSGKFVRVEPGGYVATSQHYRAKIPCESVSGYPLLNRMSCALLVGSYSYTQMDIQYTWRKFTPVGGVGDKGRYSLAEDIETTDCQSNYTTGSYSCLRAELVFDGGCGESFVRVYLPSLVLLLLSWAHFWLHPVHSVPRAFSAVLPFLIFAVVMLLADQPILKTAGFTTVQVWLIVCLVLTGLSALEYFVVMFLRASRTSDGHDVEDPLLVARQKPQTEEVAQSTQTATAHRRGCRAATGLDLLSRLVFPVIFIIFLIVYLLINLI